MSGLIATFTGISAFIALTYLEVVNNIFRDFPLIILGLSMVIFFQRKTIANAITGNKVR